MNVALGVLGGLAIPVILIALIVQRSRQAIAELRPLVARQGETLAAIGEELGLRYEAAEPGAFSWGRLGGELGGVPISVRGYSPRSNAHWLQIRRRGPASLVQAAKARWNGAESWHADGELVVIPPGTRARAKGLEVRTIPDAAELRRWIEDVAALTAE
jgi:hypothetical protein